jgi:hypothetical protein
MTTPSDTYFATLKGPALARALHARVDAFQKYVEDTGFFAVWLKAHQFLYGMQGDGYRTYEVARAGAEGEYTKIALNHFRNLLTHYTTLATAQRSAMEPVAATNDYQSEVETRNARGILDCYMRKGLEEAMLACVDYSAAMGHAFLGQRWDAHAGAEYLPALEPETPALPAGDGSEAPPPPLPPSAERTGDMAHHAFMPTDVAFDPRAKSHKLDWYITRRYVNRFDLIARYPEAREAILKVTRGPLEKALDFREAAGEGLTAEEGDEVALYEFWHEKRPALPAGAYVPFLDADTLLMQSELPCEEVPLRRLAPDNIHGTPFGYTAAWDLLAPQEALNALASIALTNQRAHGVGLVAVPKGGDIKATQLARGLAMVEYTPGLPEPKAINLTSTPQEVFTNQDRIVGHMETLSGVNSVVRGNPEASLKSGSALALVQAQAVQFSSKFQGHIIRFQEAVGTDTILLFQAFATVELQLEVTGQDGVMSLRGFTGESVKSVRRVRVDAGNPLAKTLAGRIQIAEALVKQGFIKDPAQYLRVLETGRLEPITEHEERERANIKAENELLAAATWATDASGVMQMEPDPTAGLNPLTGEPLSFRPALDKSKLPVALPSDNHPLHGTQHLVVLQSPVARRNAAVVRAVLDHVQYEHKDAWVSLTLNNPELLELLGIPPCTAAVAKQQAMAAAQQAALGAGPTPPGAPGPSTPPGRGAPTSPKSAGGPSEGPPGAQQQPAMPQMPANPTNGVRPEAPGPGGSPI